MNKEAVIDRNLNQIYDLLKEICKISKTNKFPGEEYKADKMKKEVADWLAGREFQQKVMTKGSMSVDDVNKALQNVKLAPHTWRWVKKKILSLSEVKA
jgi:hypothetical protein